MLGLDGGGVRSLMTLEALKYIEARTGRPINAMFDVIAGTSAGGMLALALARRNGLSAEAIAEVFMQRAPSIFYRSWGQTFWSMGQMNGPKYDNAALYQCAIDMLGGATPLYDVYCSVMVPTYDLAKRSPRLYSTWGTPAALMVDASMSSSAAPSYFAPWGNNIDGGVMSNAPALTAVIEACRLYKCTVRDVVCISIGTGSDNEPYDGKAAASWGLLSWAEPLVNIFTDGTSAQHTEHLLRLMPDAQVCRVQCEVKGPLAVLDNASSQNLAALRARGQQMVADNKAALDALIDQLA